MAVPGYVIDILFGGIGPIPHNRCAVVPAGTIFWNYTTWLKVAFLPLAALLVVRFVRTGSAAMLPMMGGPPGTSEHGHAGT